MSALSAQNQPSGYAPLTHHPPNPTHVNTRQTHKVSAPLPPCPPITFQSQITQSSSPHPQASLSPAPLFQPSLPPPEHCQASPMPAPQFQASLSPAPQFQMSPLPSFASYQSPVSMANHMNTPWYPAPPTGMLYPSTPYRNHQWLNNPMHYSPPMFNNSMPSYWNINMTITHIVIMYYKLLYLLIHVNVIISFRTRKEIICIIILAMFHFCNCPWYWVYELLLL